MTGLWSDKYTYIHSKKKKTEQIFMNWLLTLRREENQHKYEKNTESYIIYNVSIGMI